jgi:hypothetical protein
MGWAGHVARIAESRGLYKFLMGKLEESVHFVETGVDGK